MNDHEHDLSYRFHHHHWNMEVGEYYVFHTLYQIAHSTLNLYLPIYLLQIGYDVREVVLWHVLNRALCTFATLYAGKVVQWLGMKKAIALKLPFVILYYAAAQQLSGVFLQDLWFMLPVMAIRAFGMTPSHVADDLFLARYVLRRARGRMLARLKILSVAAGILSPLVGGAIAAIWGFEAMFTAGSALILLSAVPLFLTHDRHFAFPPAPAGAVLTATRRLPRPLMLAEIGAHAPDVVLDTVWALLLFFVVGNLTSIGAVVSGSALLAMVLSYRIGRGADERDPAKTLRVGVWAHLGLYALRAVALQPVLLGLANAAVKVTGPLLGIPYDYYFFGYLRRQRNAAQVANARRFLEEGIGLLAALAVLGAVLAAPEGGARLFGGILLAAAPLIPLAGRITALDPPLASSSRLR